MLSYDDREFQANMNGIAAAVRSTTFRAVPSMGLNAKDRTLAALKQNLERPTPFTVRPGAYQSSPVKLSGDEASTIFSVGDLQAAYLKWVFDGGIRKPGDAGTSKSEIWLPGWDTKDKFGGLRAGMVARFIKKAQAGSKKLKSMTQAQKAQRAAGKKNVPHAWDKKHVGVGAVMHNGKKTWGVWEFPARQRIVSQVPVMRNGAPVFKKAKGGRRGFNGRFAKKGAMVQLMRQRAQLVEVGEPKRIAEGRKVTRHPKLIDFDALTGVPPERRRKVRRLLREGAAQPGAGVT